MQQNQLLAESFSNMDLPQETKESKSQIKF